jgi:hypothetical protein
MSTALVLGARGSGLTTFVGLLYTAQVRLGTEDADEFRFSADRATIRELEEIYGELGSGRFPVRDADWEEHPLSFVLAFRHGLLHGIGHGGNGAEFDTVRVQVGGIPVEEVAELRAHEAVLEPATRQLLRSQVVLPLVDATALVPESDEATSARLGRADHILAETLHLLVDFVGAERDRRRRRLYPLFVVTKADLFHRETLTQLRAPEGLPSTWTSEARREFGDRLLHRFFPETSRFLAAPRARTAPRVWPPDWYFSSLGVDASGPEQRILRRTIDPAGGWEPEYPFEEYRLLITTLARLARRAPAEPEEIPAA